MDGLIDRCKFIVSMHLALRVIPTVQGLRQLTISLTAIKHKNKSKILLNQHRFSEKIINILFYRDKINMCKSKIGESLKYREHLEWRIFFFKVNIQNREF